MSNMEVKQQPFSSPPVHADDAPIEVTEIDAAIPSDMVTPPKALTIRTRNLDRTTTNDMSTPTPSHSAGNGNQTPASTPAGSVSFSDNTNKGSPYSPYSPYERKITVKETNKVETVMERGKLVMLNDYRMLKTIGKGAFGEVKLAALQKPGADYERYAVKIIRRAFLMGGRKSLGSRADRSPGVDNSPSPANNSPAARFFGTGNSAGSDKDDSIAARVKQEIAIMKQLTHPNLVQLIEILDDPESRSLYLVMEYVEAGPIMTFDINTNTFKCSLTGGVMLEGMASRIFKDLISALGYLHLNHIAHRDIKPDNLLVDYKGNLKVSDFGVSNHFVQERQKAAVSLKTLARSQSRGAVSKTEGTFPFYSPEMCKENSTSYSAYMADIWAATICLWIFIYGKMPFYHKDVLKLFTMIRTEDPVMPHAVSPELTHLFHCLLQKDVTKRYYSFYDLSDSYRMSIIEIQRHPWLKRSITPRNTPIIVRGNTLESFDGLLTVRTYDEVDPEAVEAYSKLSPFVLDSLRQRAREARARVDDRRECMVRHSITGIRSLLTKSNKVKSHSNSDVDDIEVDVELDNFSDLSRQSSNTSDDSDPLARMVSFDDFNLSHNGPSHHHHHHHQPQKKRSNPIAVAAAAMGRLRNSASFNDDDEGDSTATIFKKMGFGRSKSKKNTEERPTSTKSSPPPHTAPLPAASPAPQTTSTPTTPTPTGLRPGRRRTAPPVLALSPAATPQRSPTIVEEDERSATPVEPTPELPPHGCCIIA